MNMIDSGVSFPLTLSLERNTLARYTKNPGILDDANLTLRKLPWKNVHGEIDQTATPELNQ